MEMSTRMMIGIIVAVIIILIIIGIAIFAREQGIEALKRIWDVTSWIEDWMGGGGD